MKRREVKSKGEKERYKHLNAEFQRKARRDKKAFIAGLQPVGEGDGAPLQSSCLENPRDGGACWAAAHGRRRWRPTPVLLPGEPQGRGACWAAALGVAQSQTRLSGLAAAAAAVSATRRELLSPVSPYPGIYINIQNIYKYPTYPCTYKNETITQISDRYNSFSTMSSHKKRYQKEIVINKGNCN